MVATTPTYEVIVAGLRDATEPLELTVSGTRSPSQ